MASLNLKDELSKKEEEFKASDSIFGMTLLTNPGYITSGRDIMFTAHLRQFVNLVNPEPPKVFTNYENLVGKNSTGYYASPSECEVIDIIPRFEDGEHDRHLYCMFTYDKKADRYDVITKTAVEDLTEKFGFTYNNEVLDSKEIGDIIKKDEVLFKTPSYDDDMNYCYGKNPTVMYTLDNRTIEDAIVARRGFAESMISKEVETVKVPLNDNDILCNLYGEKGEHKGFPDIGTEIKNHIVCARRRIHNNQILYDLKRSNLRKVNLDSDQLFFNEGRLVDIMIYSNKTLEEMPDNIFNAQIRHYFKMQTTFYQKMYDRCAEIIDSGSEYSADIGFYYKKAKDILDPACAWREETGNVFSNIVIEFTFERNSPLSFGSKITGRQGNKGVVSSIVDDDDMPYLANGKKVDLILNALGIVNRTNPAQIFEHSINFICNCVVDKLKTMKSLKDREKLLFDIIKRFNPTEAKELREYYNDLDKSGKEEFFNDIYESGIFIHIPPMWETEPLFDKIRNIYKDYEWIKPVDVYVKRFGREIKIMKPMIVGELYMIKLKQNSKKNFSARSTGALSRRGLPDKSFKSKAHQDLYSSKPIRIGSQENYNAFIGVSPEVIAKLHMFYRSSPIGRQWLGKKLILSKNQIKKLKSSGKIRNRNSEILSVYLKALGLRIDFLDDKYEIDVDTGEIRDFDTRDGMFIGTSDEYEDHELYNDVVSEYENDKCFVGSIDEYNALIEKEYQKAKDKRDYPIYIDVNLDE